MVRRAALSTALLPTTPLVLPARGLGTLTSVSYTHLTLPTNREV